MKFFKTTHIPVKKAALQGFPQKANAEDQKFIEFEFIILNKSYGDGDRVWVINPDN